MKKKLVVIWIIISGLTSCMVNEAPHPTTLPILRQVTGLDRQLLRAASWGDVVELEELLELGADPSFQTDNLGATPLMYAAIKGDQPMVEVLLQHGAELDARTSFGTTALMWAATNGHQEVVELLLVAGADPLIRDAENRTAKMLATAGEYEQISDLLANKCRESSK